MSLSGRLLGLCPHCPPPPPPPVQLPMQMIEGYCVFRFLSATVFRRDNVTHHILVTPQDSNFNCGIIGNNIIFIHSPEETLAIQSDWIFVNGMVHLPQE